MKDFESRRTRRGSRGLTLLEVLIVVALITLLTVGVVSGSGMLAGTRLRSAATLILTGVRMGIMQANTNGMPARLVFDLENDTILLEQTSGRMLRRLDEDEESPSAGAAPATEVEREAMEEAERILEGPREPLPTFTAVPEFLADSASASGRGRPLGEGISFISVHTEHDSEPVVEGRAYLYFWPGGGTEKAVVRIQRPGQEEGLSIVVSALTGRAQIVRGEVELDSPVEGVDFGEREGE